MRLLLVTKSFPPHVGGMETWAYELGLRFAARCADFALLAPRAAGSAEVDRGLPFEVLRVPSTPRTFPGVASAALSALWRRRRFDVLLAAQWQSSLPGLLWRKRGGPPRVYAALHERELLASPARAWPVAPALYAGTRERVLEQLDGVFPLSARAAEWLARTGSASEHAHVLSHGCDGQRFAPGAAPEKPARVLGLFGRPVLLSVGRLSARSGVSTVLHALRRLGARHPELRYLICGDGPERAPLQRQAEQLRVAHMVRFLGRVAAEALPDVYRLCNIFVSAPHEPVGCESLGLALLEASASGKPVVATTGAGLQAGVHHEHTGLLCAPEDAAALAGSLARLLDDPVLARRLGEQGRARVLEHARWEGTCTQLLAAMERRRSEQRGASTQVAAE
jgi:phosphatidylinositol alpha-1,6-mannosyltransferase